MWGSLFLKLFCSVPSRSLTIGNVIHCRTVLKVKNGKKTFLGSDLVSGTQEPMLTLKVGYIIYNLYDTYI